jgi:uncharacterized protein (DUF169 family)
MATWEERTSDLERLLRLETKPIGIRIIKDEKEVPAKAKRPSDLKQKMALCQLITIARRLGWTTVAFPEEIEVCFFPLIALGWRQVKSKEDMIKWFTDAKYCADNNIAERRAEDFLKDRPKLGIGVVYSPLSKLTIDPETVLIYGNPAQIMRLIRGYVNFTGLPIQSSFLGGLSCAESLILCRQNHQAQVVVPGIGERLFAMTNDHEMSFYVPADQVDSLIAGIQKEHDIGTARYPIPFYQFFTPQFPKRYTEFLNESLS